MTSKGNYWKLELETGHEEDVRAVFPVQLNKYYWTRRKKPNTI